MSKSLLWSLATVAFGGLAALATKLAIGAELNEEREYDEESSSHETIEEE